MFIYDADTIVTLVASADSGYVFQNWTGDVGTIADANSATTTITMTGDYAITANFSQIMHTLTMAVNGSGSAIPTEGSHDYAQGTVVNISATPASGWKFDNWTGDVADPNSASTSVTMDSSKAVTANFSQTIYTLTVLVNGNGSTVPTAGSHVYAEGTVVDISAVPDIDWEFDSWTGDVGTIADVDSATTTITMNGDYTIAADFVPAP